MPFAPSQSVARRCRRDYSGLESVTESLDEARGYGDACHAALTGYTKGLRIYYRAVRAGNRGDLDTAGSVTRQATAAFRSVSISYMECVG